MSKNEFFDKLNYLERYMTSPDSIKDILKNQSHIDKRFQAPFCCGRRMQDNRNDGTEFWCTRCNKLQRRNK